MDTIVICDSGLPIPAHVKRIDLALKQGVPSFIETIETVLTEICVEKAYVAQEMEKVSLGIKQELAEKLAGIDMQFLSDEEFKVLTHKAKAIIRTGEFTPYANVISQAGVIF